MYFILIISFKVKSQVSIGFETIYCNNTLSENKIDLPYTLFKPGNSIGFGIPISIKIKSAFSLNSGLYYIPKNYMFKRIGTYAGVFFEFKNSYLKIPIMSSFSFAYRKINIICNGGIYGAYWIFSKSSGKIPNLLNNIDSVSPDGRIRNYVNLESFNEKYSFKKNKDNRYEWGASIGIKLSYKVNKNEKIYCSTIYDYSFSDQQKKYMINQSARLNRTILFSIGYEKNVFNAQ
ncbi:MAG: outer membrane beta-barrel protein [Sediminibacterium sp.]|nr:outer membrane beta-barrel protein [Sediminibacterium sp.]